MPRVPGHFPRCPCGVGTSAFPLTYHVAEQSVVIMTLCASCVVRHVLRRDFPTLASNHGEFRVCVELACETKKQNSSELINQSIRQSIKTHLFYVASAVMAEDIQSGDQVEGRMPENRVRCGILDFLTTCTFKIVV